MGVFALLAVLLALSARLIAPLPWYGWLPVVLASALISHLLVERFVSRYTNRGVGAVLCRRDALRIVVALEKLTRSDMAKESERLRNVIGEQVGACDDPLRIYVNLARCVDRRRWPPSWAKQGMPPLFVPLGKTIAGREVALVWKHIHLCMPRSSDAEALAIHGPFVKVSMSSDAAKFVEFVAPVFERLRRQISSPTSGEMPAQDSGLRVAIVGHALDEIEFLLKEKSPGTAAIIAESHKRFLQEEGILPDEVDKIAQEITSTPEQVAFVLDAIGSVFHKTRECKPEAAPGTSADGILEILARLVISIVGSNRGGVQL